MQFQITTLAAIAAFLSGSNAISMCTDYNTATGQCAGTCQDFPIALGQTVNVPPTACCFNSDQDTGFDALICSDSNLGGSCSDLQSRRRVDITGDYNWDCGRFTRSIKRTGN